ncbi:DMT family transporter [Pokkaliibacter sp. CJK22405]|uniref:DMT family transporter n=1 Tax=Pokkaliibacter sp. CJK22405 TaxID=3384615 RepID=UPI0039856ADB
MKTSTLRADGLLLITAIIWGTAFVAQRVGMDHLGPFGFNFARFLLGTLSLLPLYFFLKMRRKRKGIQDAQPASRSLLIWGGIATGLILFMGSSFQQIGLLYTTAGKAGFITGLYLIFVPILGLAFRHKTGVHTWVGAVLALAGLYFLSINEHLVLARGDALELIGSLFWAGHVLIIAWLSKHVDAIALSIIQLITCTTLSLIVALGFETLTWQAIADTWFPIVYAGFFSVGIAYTLQIIGQKEAPPAHAAIILSGEALFAVVGGWLLIDEGLGSRELLGCGLMMAGMLVSQFSLKWLMRRKRISMAAVSS